MITSLNRVRRWDFDSEENEGPPLLLSTQQHNLKRKDEDLWVHKVAVEVIMLRTTGPGLSVLEAEDDNNESFEEAGDDDDGLH